MENARSYYSEPCPSLSYEESGQSPSTSDNSYACSKPNFPKDEEEEDQDQEEEVLRLASNNPKKPSGRKKFKETRHPVYRGVRRRNGNKWGCEMRDPNNKNSRIWLGTYPTPEMAARAHDVAAIALKGRSACLNFEDSAWRLPIPASTDTKDIQKAAAEAAKAFRPVESSSSDQVNVNANGVIPSILPPADNYIDEEEVYNMPCLLTDMAEGLMLQPPPYSVVTNTNNNNNEDDDDADSNVDMVLWNY